MKLYYIPFACSLAAHIACREAGIDVTLVRTDLSSKRAEGGVDLFGVNPMGQVPTLVTNDGHVLTENSAVLAYIADLAPERGLAPAPTTFARYELARWLSFVGTEIHKRGLAMIYAPHSPDAVKVFAREEMAKPLAVVASHLASRATLVGEGFTVADAYLVWALTLLPRGGVSLEGYPVLREYLARHMERPAVAAAFAFERMQRETPMPA